MTPAGWAIGEAVLSGTAAELLLCLWKRLPGDRLKVEGDAVAATAFLAAQHSVDPVDWSCGSASAPLGHSF